MTTLALHRIDAPVIRCEAWQPVKALTHVVALSAIVTAFIAFVLLFLLDGWTYYQMPLTVRGHHPAHRLLRPSGPVGEALGLSGFALMCVPMLYVVRKKLAAWPLGSINTWLDVHVFCGIVGPVLITFHTSFKFNGIVSLAYWIMVLVATSGFVGRYLYGFVPRTIRGTELTLAEIQHRAATLRQDLLSRGLPAWLIARVEALEVRSKPAMHTSAWVTSLIVGDLALHLRLWKLERHLRAGGSGERTARIVVALIAERVTLLRRLWLLEKTKDLLAFWHVFHQPLVAFMFLIVIAHVGLMTFMGYTMFSAWLGR